MARILHPNRVVTMEFNAQRLNLDVDAAGVIKKNALRVGVTGWATRGSRIGRPGDDGAG